MARFNEDRSWYVFSCSGFEIIFMASDMAGLVMDWLWIGYGLVMDWLWIGYGLMEWIDGGLVMD